MIQLMSSAHLKKSHEQQPLLVMGVIAIQMKATAEI